MRGGGDLASGVILRLARAGVQVLVSELPQPLVVRRLVSFAEAVYSGAVQIEECTGRLVADLADAVNYLNANQIPVLVDPQARCLPAFRPDVLVDGRMTKQAPELKLDAAPLVIGLGPGFTAGLNCHAVVETLRGHYLGRVYWQGTAIQDTGQPDAIANHQADRVVKAPTAGLFRARVQIGEYVEKGQVIAVVGGQEVHTTFSGRLRGLLHDGLQVPRGMKIGDVDPRDDLVSVHLVSDKALAVGGGVMEALLSRPDIARRMWA